MERNSNSNSNSFEEDVYSPENDTGSPSSASASATFSEMKIPSTSSPKRSRRSMQKKVISVPIKEIEGSRLKGETAPPSDSWAWRKYGQKPIKGSPYPRGYYRCSSSKGCPARKQVERSRVDPTMLVITYSCDHNHPWPPATRNSHNKHHHHPKIQPESHFIVLPDPEPESERQTEDSTKFVNLVDHDSLMLTTVPTTATGGDEFAWFGEMETTSSTILESPIFSERRSEGDTSSEDVAMYFPMREEDESLFADLGELPECSFVFKYRNSVGPQVEIC